MKRIACVWSAEAVDEGHWEAFLDYLEELSPQLELESFGTVYLEAAGMDRLYGGWSAWSQAVLQAAGQAGLPDVRLGIAGGYLAARLAAEYSPPETRWQQVPEADRAYLAGFPLEVLPLAPEPRRRMELLGMRTLGQLARLSARAVAEQFGSDVLSLYHLACGDKGAPRAIRQVRQVTAACSFDPAADGRDDLLAALLRRSQPVWDALRREGRCVRRLFLRAAGWHWQAEYALDVLTSLSGEPDLQSTLLALIAGLRLAGPVEEAEITLQGVLPYAVRQPLLWTTRDAQAELAALAGRLSRRCPDGVLRGELRRNWSPLAGEHYGLALWSAQ